MVEISNIIKNLYLVEIESCLDSKSRKEQEYRYHMFFLKTISRALKISIKEKKLKPVVVFSKILEYIPDSGLSRFHAWTNQWQIENQFRKITTF